MSVDYKTEIQSENEYLNNLEISVDTMHRNGVDYRTQLLDALDTISAMELRIKLADMKYQELNEKYVKVLSDLWNSK